MTSQARPNYAKITTKRYSASTTTYEEQLSNKR